MYIVGKATRTWRKGKSRTSHRGLVRAGHACEGCPGTWEARRSPARAGMGHPMTVQRADVSAPHGALGEGRRGAGAGSADARGDRSVGAMDCGSRSSLVVPMKPGNRTRGTRWREGGAGVMEPWRERWPGHRSSENISTKLRADSGAGEAGSGDWCSTSLLTSSTWGGSARRTEHAQGRSDGSGRADGGASTRRDLDGQSPVAARPVEVRTLQGPAGAARAHPEGRAEEPADGDTDVRGQGPPAGGGPVLEAIYEQDFLDCSYGFRPGRSAHEAIGSACGRTSGTWAGAGSWRSTSSRSSTRSTTRI